MTRIKIKDLPKDMKVGKEEMKIIRGGLFLTLASPAEKRPYLAGGPIYTPAIPISIPIIT